ncbi:transmembrane gamma-carboxyglutamic acid protein 2 [Amia ocellicauda]|uniref:transmembrane gamma-carboxyglutamic acid protein 2 n=1 Tax=Amia ocellicauda TaxID=2972642 RepID=UPI0034647826
MDSASVLCVCLTLVSLAHSRCLNRHNMFLTNRQAGSFLSRSLLYNSWDFELIVPGNLERECIEEQCTYEEAREVFEDDAKTAAFWKDYTGQDKAPHMDVSGLVAGLLALLACAVFATVIGVYCCRRQRKPRRMGSIPVRMPADGLGPPESLPLAAIPTPGLPSYNEVLASSGQHDAPPPPYSGGGPLEDPHPMEG